ncbi:multidrug transporter MatE [Haematobacter missouriensis]|uniref:MATE family efflux transporter n=1 Tax=Haematobacter missouriensis TaxID=366616 RepID=A0A212AHZ7_9RHOB|nr:MATE family efflux transporter [Haematobacter missouriensis]KFI32694.1 multidrug transporter MatE [Haematobacter missouriensis]OWJ79113.1 MATE family efflux transporter [Haematobacter missouriensis]OWJ81132.1 MATE family efflux transporter [Haematobacter missouriensis]
MARRDEKGGASPLVTGPIGTTLLLFALPTLGSSVLQSANGSIDAVWVGRLLGEDALAATTNGNLIMFMLTAFVFGFGMAATILVGQSFGRGDLDGARRVVGTTLGTFVPLAVLVSIAGWFLAPRLLGVLGTSEQITPLARDYLRVTFFAMPAILMQTMLMMALRGSGDAITPLVFMALSVVLDVVLNPVFILGLGPAPALGIGGSAMATALANYISLLAMLVYIYTRDLPLRLRGGELSYLRPTPSVLKIMFRKGLPIGIQMIVVSSSMLTMMTMVNRLGVDTTAAFGATQQLWTYVQMPAMALGAAVSAMAAQNIGAGRWDRVSRVTRAGVWFNIVLTGGLVALLALVDDKALGLFLGPDSPAIPIGQHIGSLATWGFITFGVSMVLFGTVRANGQVVWPLIILFVSMYPVRIGVAFGLQGWLGPDALWLSFPAAMVSTMLMATVLYLQGGWRKEADMRVDGDIGPSQTAVTAEAAPPRNPSAPDAPVVPVRKSPNAPSA